MLSAGPGIDARGGEMPGVGPGALQRHLDRCIRPAWLFAWRPEETLARLSDHVAGQRQRVRVREGADVLDDAAQLAIHEPSAEAPGRAELILTTDDELVLVLGFEVLVERCQRGERRRAPDRPGSIPRQW